MNNIINDNVSISGNIYIRTNRHANLAALKAHSKSSPPFHVMIDSIFPQPLPHANFHKWFPVRFNDSKKIQCIWLNISDLINKMHISPRMIISKKAEGLIKSTKYIKNIIKTHKKLYLSGLENFEILQIRYFLKRIKFLPGTYFSKYSRVNPKIERIQNCFNFHFSISVAPKRVFVFFKGKRGQIENGSSKTIKKALNFTTGEIFARVKMNKEFKFLLFNPTKRRCLIKYFDKEIFYYNKFQNHPQIAKVAFLYDLKGKMPGYIMKYYKCDLRDFLLDTPTSYITLNIIINLIKQIAKGVAILHQNQCIHCDIKPENILINYDILNLERSNASISDLENILDFSKNPAPKIYSYRGTYIYSPPELLHYSHENPSKNVMQIKLLNRHLQSFSHQENPELELGKKMDIWALGLTLYVMLYKNFPRFISQMGITIHERVNISRSWQHKFGLYFPLQVNSKKDQLDRIIWKLLNPTPIERPSIEEILTELDQL